MTNHRQAIGKRKPVQLPDGACEGVVTDMPTPVGADYRMVNSCDVDIKAADNLAVQCERLAVEVEKVIGPGEMAEMADLYAQTMRAYATMLQANAVEALHNEAVAESLSDGILQ